jgi:hypothetical protein
VWLPDLGLPQARPGLPETRNVAAVGSVHHDRDRFVAFFRTKTVAIKEWRLRGEAKPPIGRLWPFLECLAGVY